MTIHDLMFDVIMVIGIGSSIEISTSKILKITAIRKNRDENGSRAEFFGSNPHSNGDLFSRSSLIFFEIRVVSIIMADDSRMDTIAVVIITLIYKISLFFTSRNEMCQFLCKLSC